MLLSDRLYHAQVGQAAPDGGRMQVRCLLAADAPLRRAAAVSAAC